MAKVLRNFLVGVGMDTEDFDKGAKKVEGGLDRMLSLVTITGAAMLGAFGGAATMAINAGKRIDDLNRAAEGLKTPTRFIYDYGRALAAMGGDAADALATIRDIETAQSNLELKGKLGPLEDVALARGDIKALEQTQTGDEFLRVLAGMIPQMNKDQQRLVQNALGLTDGVMRSLRKGVDEFEAEIARAGRLLGDGFDNATQSARDFNRAAAELGTRLDGIGDTLAEKILPGFASVLNKMGEFIDNHRDYIEQGIDASIVLSDSASVAQSGVTAPFRQGPGGGLFRGIEAAANYGRSKTLQWLGYGEPVYSGGEVSNAEAAGTNPSAGATRPNPPVYSGGEVSNAEAASSSPSVVMVQERRRQAAAAAKAPSVTVKNDLDVKLEIDGQALNSRITEVQERRERSTADDIQSSVAR